MALGKILCFVAAVVLCAGVSDSDFEEAIKFLSKYGYLDNADIVEQRNATVLRDAVALFQDYYRLPGDGGLNEETMRYMRKPRCGVRDIPQRTALDQHWRRWPKKNLTWNFLMAQRSYLEAAREAFDMWARHSALTFTRVNRLDPDILISFQRRAHANMNAKKTYEICDTPFDGPGNVLAHAMFPDGSADFAGEVHLDHEETWHITVDKNPPHKTSMYDILIHEIGHALGLEHNTRNDSVMFPFNLEKKFPIKLSIEDILNVQNLYGSNVGPPVSNTTETAVATTTATTANPVSMDLCALKYADAVLVANRRLYVIYKRHIWSVSLDGRSYSKPMLVTDYLKFLPHDFARISAVYQRPSGDIVLFVNKLAYSMENPSLTLQEGWPKNFTALHLPANARINAALNTNTGRTFVLYDNGSVAEIDERYMLATKFNSLDLVFPGIPSTATSAFRYINGNLYFLNKQGRAYYEFNEFTNAVTKAGKFDVTLVNVACPTDGLLQRLQNLLYRIAAVHNAFQRDDDDVDGDDDENNAGM